jgi:hypothetical protein
MPERFEAIQAVDADGRKRFGKLWSDPAFADVSQVGSQAARVPLSRATSGHAQASRIRGIYRYKYRNPITDIEHASVGDGINKVWRQYGGESFGKNPIGEFDPDEWLARYRAGAPVSEFLDWTCHEPVSPIRGQFAEIVANGRPGCTSLHV